MTRRYSLTLLRALFIVPAILFSFGAAFAEPADEVPTDMLTPPRLAVAEGNVSLWRPGATDWEQAQINAVLAEGDSLYTGDDATVEVQIGPRDFVRMQAGNILTLKAHRAALMHFRLGSGNTSFDLRGDRAGQLLRIDTADANIVAAEQGYYRVSTREGETRLIVRRGGRAVLTLSDGSHHKVDADEEIVVNGNGIDTHAAPPPDVWDRWNDARSDYYAAAESNRYVPADVYGVADLDGHGRWREDDSYGWIWVPAVAAGWAPYSTGDWYDDPVYGWTWVDVAPWGWATSHYGRWVFVGSRWAWAPGPRTVRFVYAPALVAFFNFSGGISWVALGWGEPLLPWWGRPGFRGSFWWGGWGGPRETANRDRHRNRYVGNGLITVRDKEFGRHRVRGSSFPTPLGGELRPVRGDHPIHRAPNRAFEPRTSAPPPRLERRVEPRPSRTPESPQRRSVEPESRVPVPRPQVIVPTPSRAVPRNPEPDVQSRARSRVEDRMEDPRPAPAARSPVRTPVVPGPAPVVLPPRSIEPPRQPPAIRRPQLEAPRERQPDARAQPRWHVITPSAPTPRPAATPETDRRRDREPSRRTFRPRSPDERD
ncbi:MAG: hypothetical protein KJ634_12200 [Gammaproteobacteria bacterium]|nr:hypothetical protein [Gammaproteobacteria bacterium]MBU1416375.1 hypothetical protein [Gammaproteobacteria bacterium]